MSFDEEYIDPHGECAAEIAKLKSERDQALRELELVKRGSENLARTYVAELDAACAAHGAALRELGEARAAQSELSDIVHRSLSRENRLQAERDAALRSTAELTRERDEAYKRFDTAVEHRNRVIGALDAARLDNAELRGALEEALRVAESNFDCGDGGEFIARSIRAIIARTALASSSATWTAEDIARIDAKAERLWGALNPQDEPLASSSTEET